MDGKDLRSKESDVTNVRLSQQTLSLLPKKTEFNQIAQALNAMNHNGKTVSSVSIRLQLAALALVFNVGKLSTCQQNGSGFQRC